MAGEEYYDNNAAMNEAELMKMASLMGATPQAEDKQNQFTFINNVATTLDTTRVGNVSDIELGNSKYPIRSFKNAALISDKIMENSMFTEYFNAESLIVTDTSLSREGFLVKQAGTSTRQVADITKRRKPNKGWFAKKEPEHPGSYADTGGYAVG